MTARLHVASARKNFMPQGYCVKCKAKKEIVDAVEETMKNGRKAIKGKCPTCGTIMFKILGGKASAAPAAAPAAPATEQSTPKPV
jgi:Zn finger protein HypA/HybF involved in hydrogenase expression